MKSRILVMIQLGTIIAILLTGPLVAQQPIYLFVEIAGTVIGLWALIVMGTKTFSVLPDVKDGGHHIRQGPYRWIRHPMYLALLLVVGALVLALPTWLRLLLWILLLVDILLKIAYEEMLLATHYSTYATYQSQTKRLLPWLY